MSEPLDIAIIGLSTRLPGARDYRQLWDNLISARESVTFFAPEELPRDFAIVQHPHYVRAAGCLPDYDRFDAAFFGIPERMAAMYSPDHRQFIEGCWEALEDSGYTPERCPKEVGVYGACTPENIARYKLPPDWISAGKAVMEHAYGWCPDSLAANILRYLQLSGEALTVSTFCVGALASVQLACQSLLLGQVDMALAGGVCVRTPQRRGYLHEPGGVLSADGHTRPFDADGTGSILSSGVVAVVLKRLSDALEDGDHVYAVIKGTALANGGFGGVEYGAPQPQRLAQCMAFALQTSNVPPSSISYVECHGIGHPLSDTLELDAVRRAYAGGAARSCAVGSIKGNLGHCGTAATGAALAKVILSLQHRVLPPSLHFQKPHPQHPLDGPGGSSPLYVNSQPAPWSPRSGIRRAGITGIAAASYYGHMVVEEAPRSEPSQRPHCDSSLVVLSARTAEALEQQRANLRRHLQQHPELPIHDVAYTLSTGRRAMAHRWAAVVSSAAELCELLGERDQDSRRGTYSGVSGSEAAPADSAREQPVPAPPSDRPVHATNAASMQRELAVRWVRGTQVDWERYFKGLRLHRVPLPTYPFARTRHWLEAGISY
jgi:3-oxoacyl-[acyl-carrier-protein] synthase II